MCPRTHTHIRACAVSRDELITLYHTMRRCGGSAECISPDSFFAMMRPLGAADTLSAELLYNAFDDDHSGDVSFQEFAENLGFLARGSPRDRMLRASRAVRIRSKGTGTAPMMLVWGVQ